MLQVFLDYQTLDLRLIKTICTVTVVTASNGFAVRFADMPAAITTIIVSPIALEIANKNHQLFLVVLLEESLS